MELYVIRHGESEANKGRFLSGWAQVQLTEQGLEDAAMAGRMLSGIHFDRVYSSDLIRAVNTCRIALPGAVPEQLQELREIDVGRLMYLSIDDCVQQHGELFAQARKTRNYALFGGESHQMQCERVGRFLQMLVDTCGANDKIAAFCHGGTLITMLGVVLNADTSTGVPIAFNGAVTKFRYKNGRWELIYWNRTEEV